MKGNGSVLIRGNKTALRPIHSKDIAHIEKWDNDPEIARLVGKKFINSRRQREYTYPDAGRSTNLAFGVLDLHSGRLIGDLELQHICWRSGSAELRVCIGERGYWGKGYGQDAIQAFLRHIFEQTSLKYIYLRVYTSNKRAISCYKKCGFVAEAMLRAGRRVYQGHEDLLLMGLARPC